MNIINTPKSLNLLEIGSRIRDERENLGLSREKFAELVSLSSFYIGQIERGDRGMSLETLIKISATLKVSTDYIISGKTYASRNNLIMESIEDYYKGEIAEEVKELLNLLSKVPKEKTHLITDIIKLILPHLSI